MELSLIMDIVGDARDLEPTPSPSPSPLPTPSPSPSSSTTLDRMDSRPSTPPSSRLSSQDSALLQATMKMPFGSAPAVAKAKAQRESQAHIHTKTTRVMRVRTATMFAHASRDYQRQSYAPMRRTRPVLLTRRYSVDVNMRVDGRETCEARDRMLRELEGAAKEALLSNELDLITRGPPPLPFPTPQRYHFFTKYALPYPPSNNATFLALDTTLSNNKWHWMTHTSGPETNMHDDALDMALAVLSHNLRAPAAHIALCTSVDAQISYHPDPSGKEDFPTRFGTARWLFLPVNNGMRATTATDVAGIHWAVVALDRIHRTAHYYDAVFVRDAAWRALAAQIATGMLRALGEDVGAWRFVGEAHSPCQWRDNRCGWDGAACAPWVFCLVDVLVRYVQRCQREGGEGACRLGLDASFPGQFREVFDSARVRRYMQHSIAVRKVEMEVERCAERHHWVAVGEEKVEVVDESPVGFDVPLWSAAERVGGEDGESDEGGSECSDSTADSDETLADVGVEASPEGEAWGGPMDVDGFTVDANGGWAAEGVQQEGEHLPRYAVDDSVNITVGEAIEDVVYSSTG